MKKASLPASSQGPLHGIKVLDLTRLLPGPLCGQHLADMGADVIKIEDTGAGDYVRKSLREQANRGKKGLRLNLKTDAGKEVFLKLVKKCDVVLESFRPGVMARLGLSFEHLSQHNPRLVYCAISGFGQTGAYRNASGHDINFQALTGILNETGTPDSPAIPGFLLGDLAGGTLSATAGIMAALLQAQRTGEGQFVDVSMLDSLMALSALPVALLNEGAEFTERGRGTHTGGTAHYNVYETADGRHLAVGAQEKKFWDVFCDAIDCSHLRDRHSHVPEENVSIKVEVAAAIKSHTLDTWLEIFRDLDCCVSPVRTIDEAISDKHFRERGVIGDNQNAFHVGLPFTLSGCSVEFSRPSPSPGEHTHEILRGLGYDEQAISDLESEGAIAGPK